MEVWFRVEDVGFGSRVRGLGSRIYNARARSRFAFPIYRIAPSSTRPEAGPSNPSVFEAGTSGKWSSFDPEAGPAGAAARQRYTPALVEGSFATCALCVAGHEPGSSR